MKTKLSDNINRQKELEQFLYPIDEGIIQRVYGTTNKKAIAWIPGKLNTALAKQKVQNYALIGYTGKVYSADAQTMNSPYTLYWVGLDIDDYSDWKKVHEILPHASLFRSTGGNGLHVIHRIEPIPLNAGSCSNLVQYLQRNFVTALKSNDIPVCKSDSRTFWLVGGKNETLYFSKNILEISMKIRQEAQKREKRGQREKGNYYPFDSLLPRVQTAVKVLIDLGILELYHPANTICCMTDIWIKEVYKKLKNTPYQISTRSPMKSQNWECNGFISVSRNSLIIKGFADNKACLTVNDLSEIN